MLSCSDDLVQLHVPVASSYSRFSWLTSGSLSQSRKILRKFFKKSGFLSFSPLRLVTCSRVKSPIARVTQKFSRLPSRLPYGWNFQSRKTLRQIFQKFCLKYLAAYPSNLFRSQKSRVLHFEGYFQGSFQKPFIVPSCIIIIDHTFISRPLFSPWPLCLFMSKRGRAYSRVIYRRV